MKMQTLAAALAVAVGSATLTARAVDYEYEFNGPDTVMLTGVVGEVPVELVIPETLSIGGDDYMVTVIGEDFLEDNLTLKSVVFPESLIGIENGAFCGCVNLESVYLNDGLVYIEWDAFDETTSLKEVEFPASLGDIADAFNDTAIRPGEGLERISIRGGNNERFSVIDGLLYDHQRKAVVLACANITEATIPEGCELIDWETFWGCYNLRKVTFPSSLKEVATDAFCDCFSLEELDFSNTQLEQLGSEVFSSCFALKRVTFPATLKKVGVYLFVDAIALESVTFLGNAPAMEYYDEEDDLDTLADQAPNFPNGEMYVTIDYDWSAFDWATTPNETWEAMNDLKYTKVLPNVTTYVTRGTTGWGNVPGTWQNRPVAYVGEVPTPVPEAVHVATTEAAPVDKAAAAYNGFLKDAAGKIAGSVQLKLTKAGKDGTSKVTGTVQLGSKKEKVSGTYKGGVLTAAGFSNVTLDFNGITGTYKTYTIDGSRNVFAAKDAASKDAAKAALAKYKGAYTVAWQEGGVWGGVTVTVANKGKARVAGFLPNGTKVGADGQLMLGDGAACMTLVSKNKKTPLAFNLWLTGGAAVVDGLGSDTHAAKAGALASGKSFTCSLLGTPAPVTVAGKKWSVTTDKATALKFTFNAKAGSFKGSFKVGKQKVTVNGVVVNGLGYGSAVIKKGAKAAVTIE